MYIYFWDGTLGQVARIQVCSCWFPSLAGVHSQLLNFLEPLGRLVPTSRTEGCHS